MGVFYLVDAIPLNFQCPWPYSGESIDRIGKVTEVGLQT